jgi:hypothetical protein
LIVCLFVFSDIPYFNIHDRSPPSHSNPAPTPLILLAVLLFVIGSSFFSVDKCGIRWTLSSSYQSLANEWDLLQYSP